MANNIWAVEYKGIHEAAREWRLSPQSLYLKRDLAKKDIEDERANWGGELVFRIVRYIPYSQGGGA